jgi:CRP-like cAMP-binding protein
MIFLNNDYIIYRNDVGEEMYFILSGRVHILSINELKILNKLDSGFFGEIAVIFDSPKRTRSVVSDKLCQVTMIFNDIYTFLKNE